mmetsp:Transcript_2401/g.9430  ORF Transcript_2401/g.9430 Transcript_2401/m.9430 type:complete len:347 (+) Transcript_2401:4978-6018(+)
MRLKAYSTSGLAAVGVGVSWKISRYLSMSSSSCAPAAGGFQYSGPGLTSLRSSAIQGTWVASASVLTLNMGRTRPRSKSWNRGGRLSGALTESRNSRLKIATNVCSSRTRRRCAETQGASSRTGGESRRNELSARDGLAICTLLVLARWCATGRNSPYKRCSSTRKSTSSSARIETLSRVRLATMLLSNQGESWIGCLHGDVSSRCSLLGVLGMRTRSASQRSSVQTDGMTLIATRKCSEYTNSSGRCRKSNVRWAMLRPRRLNQRSMGAKSSSTMGPSPSSVAEHRASSAASYAVSLRPSRVRESSSCVAGPVGAGSPPSSSTDTLTRMSVAAVTRPRPKSGNEQ